MKKNILFVTGSRAEYDILKNLTLLFSKDKNYNTQILITGTHLSHKFGLTVNNIKEGKISKIYKIPIIRKTDSFGIVNSSSLLISKISKIFVKKKPNILVCVGDRYEIFMTCFVATIFKIPIVHFHGGELTREAYDDCFRHSITKMSEIHFTSHSIYKKRIIQMGENPKRIFNIGSMSLENVRQMNFLKKKEIETKFNIKFNEINFLITYHPVTLKNNSEKVIDSIVKACNKFKDVSIIITAPNSDTDSHKIIKKINILRKRNKNVYYIKSFGQLAYLSTAKLCNLVIGNSSSGIIEIPMIGKYSLNVGNRQYGRISPKTVINCSENFYEIFRKIKSTLKIKTKPDETFFKKNSSLKAYKIIKKYNFNKSIGKEFFDVPFKF